MKRKGRTHLPKVGTRPAMEQSLQDRRAHAMHPFAEDPYVRRGPNSWIIGVAVAIVVAIGIIALIAAT
jgi:hypothetical protein